VLDYILYLYICVSFTQRWSSLDVTNILSLLDRMCQTFKFDFFIITQALRHRVQLQESFKLWQRRCLYHFIYILFWVLWSSGCLLCDIRKHWLQLNCICDNVTIRSLIENVIEWNLHITERKRAGSPSVVGSCPTIQALEVWNIGNVKYFSRKTNPVYPGSV